MPDAIAGLAGPPPTMLQPASSGADSALSALSGMGTDGFLKLLVAQLRYQSPLEPSDPGDMMLQTAQLAQLDATQQLLNLQQRDLGLQQAVVAAGLVGQQVTATTAEGLPITGTVDAVRYTTAGPVLDVGGREVALGQVSEIRRAGSPDPVAAPTPPPPAGTDAGELSDDVEAGTDAGVVSTDTDTDAPSAGTDA